MASAQLDVDHELKNMVLSFRVSELQVLLGHAGRNKSGRKHELMSRALQLIRSSGSNKLIQSTIHDLYGKRHALSNNNSQPNTVESPHQSMTVRDVPHPKPVNPPQAAPIVQFKPSPFYKQISEVLQPSCITNSKSKMAHSKNFTFLLTHHQREVLCKDRVQVQSMIRQSPKNHTQIQLRFCKLETSCEQPDALPPHLTVKVNNVSVVLPNFIPPTKAGMEPRRPNRPLNITNLCRHSSSGQNTLEVRYSSSDHEEYCVTVNVVKQLFAEDLLQKLKSQPVLSAATTRYRIKEKLKRDLDSDVSTTNLKLSLRCPLGKMRILTPIRGCKCTHIQCFDALLYIRMNERKPTWSCPVCDKLAEFTSLVIDGLFIEILNESDSDEIDFTDDGNWNSSKNVTETLIVGTPIKPIALDLSRTAPKIKPASEKKRSEPDVIDLTCDSSDDDSPIEVASSNQNSGSENVLDDITMSVSSSPADVGSPNVAPRLLDVPLTKYTRKSPSTHRDYHHTTATPPRLHSPYYRPVNSPSWESKYTPTISPRRNTPPNPRPLIHHHSPVNQLNGSVMTPPPLPSPSPLVSGASPPVASTWRTSLPGERGMGLNGYSTPPVSSLVGSLNDHSLNMGFPPFSAFDILNQQYRHHQFPLLFPPGVGSGLTPYDLFPPRIPHTANIPERSRTDYREEDYPDIVIE
uniref:Protein inhibitor of activated STAT n=1 Tax=Ciona intestinalis TaxID=7719 RepID=Q4H2Y4_CIOIN|nr:protein inhibitor of activated STAT [Ciona intestinalis]BAE06643.1 protein inhibitor of activated STAT [Ciona intestinalis]|eukprot:NP_001071800.1 protein inhibitor of activated STAT [Ciona intestinalis]